MEELKCSACGQTFAEEFMLTREDNSELVCEACSGLLDEEEDLSCIHDEW